MPDASALHVEVIFHRISRCSSATRLVRSKRSDEDIYIDRPRW